jgi:hypothetical protein
MRQPNILVLNTSRLGAQGNTQTVAHLKKEIPHIDIAGRPQAPTLTA